MFAAVYPNDNLSLADLEIIIKMVILDIPFLFTCCGYMWIMVTVYVSFFVTQIDQNAIIDRVAPYYVITAILAILMYLLQAS